MSLRSLCIAALASVMVWFSSGKAAEALWPFDRIPVDQIKKDWGFAPDAQWLARVQHASVRVRDKSGEGGGSGAVVSPDGLIITNQHVIAHAMRRASSEKRNLVRDGFYARSKSEELDIGMEIHVLKKVVNVSDAVKQETEAAERRQECHRSF